MKRMKLCWAVLLIVVFIASQADALRKSQSGSELSNNPQANPKAVVLVGRNARFTVLTSHVIRMEWSANGNFEDRATFAIVNRNLPVPSFTVNNSSGNAITITTDNLSLVYNTNGAGLSPEFSAANLAITLRGDGLTATWNMNSTNTGNLLGTIRTLDGINGAAQLDCAERNDLDDSHCTFGLISRSGWSIIDESQRPVFDGQDWSWWAKHTDSTYDWYFLGHGLAYEQALTDFSLIGGKIPLPPRFSFGIWWSRYWAFSDIEFMSIVDQYSMHQVPLDVLVIDMDWHITFYKEASEGQRDQAGQEPGWTGYTWDSNLFPNPAAFMKWVGSKNLQSTVNIHPASGVQPHEAAYAQMAVVSGIDPATKKYVPFDITNQTFAKNYYEIMLKPLVEQGIDFFWLDWQQGEDFLNIPGMNPTFWLNYFFFTNPAMWEAEGNKLRPLLFHRWGGLGNHRYQIGFTGDVVPAWASLQFQPYFTATAANVGYGFWSHDIGGHTAPSPPELFTRWVQWGAFAPVLRTHCTKSADNDRRIWAYPLENFFIMRSAMVLRASLVPYIYTAARISHDTGISMLRSLYYSWPTHDEAYVNLGEYIFGDDMVVSPVTAPGDANGLTQVSVWIPPGEWIEWFSGISFFGPTTVTRQFALDDIPVYVRAGSIIPMVNPSDREALIGSTQYLPETLSFVVFVSSGVTNGSTFVYEDNGVDDGYLQQSNTVWTEVTYTLTGGNVVEVVVLPVENTFEGFPTQRNYRIVLNGVFDAAGSVLVNNEPTSSWSYDGNNLALEVDTGSIPTSKGCVVRVTLSHSLNEPAAKALRSGIPLAIRRAATVQGIIDNQWAAEYQEDYEHVILAASASQRMNYVPSSAYNEITGYAQLFATGMKEVYAFTKLQPAVQSQVENLLASAQPRG